MERVIKVSHSGNTHPRENGSNEQTVVLKPEKGSTFIDMQHQMENELERRRKDWEKEVEKMQEDFFNVKVTKDDTINANRTIEVQAPSSGSVQKKPPMNGDIFEIGNAKTLYNEKPDGTKVVTFKFDVYGFDPHAITVRAEGSKITVSAQYEEENYPGNKNTRRHNRQVDIPPGVNPDNFTSYLSNDGILTVEAPVTEPIPEEEPQVIEIGYDGNPYQNYLHDSPALNARNGASYERVIHASPGRNPGTEASYERVIHASPSYKIGGISSGPQHYSLHTSSYGGRSPHSTTTTKIQSLSPRTERVTSKQKGNPKTIIQPKKGELTTVSPGGTVIVRTSDTYLPFETELVSPLKSPLGRNALGGKNTYGHPNIITTEEGQRCKITVTLGTSYSPEEIIVSLHHTKISVKAMHEETVGGRQSKSEFSREFDIPSPIEPSTFKAVVSRDGTVTIGGSLKDNKNHDEVMALVYCDMPLNGRACKVIVD